VKNRHKPIRTLASAAVLGIMAVSVAKAGGFSLYTEGNGYSTGNYGAGVAAEAADASTGWYNPAGLALIHSQQLVLGGVGVIPTSSISGMSTFSSPDQPIPSYVQTFKGLDGGENAIVPSLHYALPLGERTTFGLSVVSPFGLSTNWDLNSPVRYQATLTELLAVNVSPEIGGQLTEHFALGGGLDLQFARVKFNKMLGAPNIFTIIPPFNPSAVDSLSYNQANSFGVGFHAGAMAFFNDKHTRLGLNYQSQMRHTFHGSSRLTGVLANTFNLFGPLPAPGSYYSNNLVSNEITLPDVVTLSGYHDLNEAWALLGSIVYTGWNSFHSIQLNNVAAPAINDFGEVTLAKVNSASLQEYKNVWRVSLGANYIVNEQLMLRAGGGYDQTPTNDLYRDIRLPDASRWALAIGAHYQMKYNLGVDVGYTHLFPADTPTLNRTDLLGTTAAYNVTASGNAHAELFGAQLVWSIDKEKAAPMK
jgi:long-chain fatty acid transport protein